MHRALALVLLFLASCGGQPSAQLPSQPSAKPASGSRASIVTSAYDDSSIGPPATDPEATAALQFVQDFYKFYAGIDYNLQDAVAQRPGVFSQELLDALKADFAAQEKSPGELVGLDWEPFSASQDPCGPFQATRASRVGSVILVAMRGLCTDAQPRHVPDAIAKVVRGAEGWQFADLLRGDDRTSLLVNLAQLRDERVKYSDAPKK